MSVIYQLAFKPENERFLMESIRRPSGHRAVLNSAIYWSVKILQKSPKIWVILSNIWMLNCIFCMPDKIRQISIRTLCEITRTWSQPADPIVGFFL